MVFTVVFAGAGFYYIRNRDVRRHGEMMIRLLACWFSIPFFRMTLPFYRAFAGPQWAFAVGGWVCYIVPLCVAELYIRYSGRFAAAQPVPSPVPDTMPSFKQVIAI